MNAETTRKLKALEHLLLKVRVINEEIDTLKESLVPELDADTKVETDSGIFTVESRSKYVYSSETLALEKELKTTKKREEADGTAERTSGDPFIVYREKKEAL